MKSLYHYETRYNGRKIIIDTAQLPGGQYETMVMYSNGDELSSHTTPDPDKAADAFAAAVELYERMEDARPLVGKYAALADALTAAVGAAKAHLFDDDGGTCNFDAPALYLPHWSGHEIERAARAAGLRCFTWSLGKKKRYVFSVPVPGQGNRRSNAAEAMTAALEAAGYDALTYCQMD